MSLFSPTGTLLIKIILDEIGVSIHQYSSSHDKGRIGSVVGEVVCIRTTKYSAFKFSCV